jgi:hypothetical protein
MREEATKAQVLAAYLPEEEADAALADASRASDQR